MRLDTRAPLPAILLLLLTVVSPAAAQTGPTLDEIMKLPVSPGSVALLIRHVTEPPAVARLGAALRDASPNVRAAAARVMFVGGIRGMAAPIMVALAQETSPAAAIEEIRFLVHFGNADHLKPIQDAVARLGEPVATSAAIELARNEGTVVLSRLALFRAAGVRKETLSAVIGRAAKGDRAAFERVLRDALSANDDRVVGAALDAAVVRSVFDLPEPLLLAVVTHAAPAVSIEGAWYLAQSWDGDKPWPPGLLRGMQTALEAQGADPVPAVRFARELVARHGGAKPTTSVGWQTLLSSLDSDSRFLVQRPFAIDVLSAKELDTVGRALGTSAKALRENRERRDPPAPKAPPAGAIVVPSLEAASGYPPEFASDVFKVTGCVLASESDRTRSDGTAGGLLTLRVDGRPASIEMLGARVAQPACLTATATLLSTSVAEVRGIAEPDTAKTLLVPFDPAFYACQEASHARPAVPMYTGRPGFPKPPQKTVNVPPTYPPGAINGRVQGIVLLEAVISREGCITGARVLRGVDGRLDWAAVAAVIQWRFAPTLLNGVPVPVILLVSVQFTLS